MARAAESILQINLMNWLRFNYPDIEKDTWHMANERQCSVHQGRLLKRLGVKRGISDLFIAVPMSGYHGLFLELKEGNGKPSKEQKEFLSRMLARGYAAVCVTGLDAAKSVIESYLRGNNVSI